MKIKYSKRETKNLGNYENATVEISIEDTIDPLIESKEEGFIRLRKFVLDRMANEFNNESTEVKLDIQDVRNKVSSLVDKDENNRKVIKAILASYNATKLQELTYHQLEEVNRKLETL